MLKFTRWILYDDIPYTDCIPFLTNINGRFKQNSVRRRCKSPISHRDCFSQKMYELLCQQCFPTTHTLTEATEMWDPNWTRRPRCWETLERGGSQQCTHWLWLVTSVNIIRARSTQFERHRRGNIRSVCEEARGCNGVLISANRHTYTLRQIKYLLDSFTGL